MSDGDADDMAEIQARIERLDSERQALQAKLAALTQTGGGAWVGGNVALDVVTGDQGERLVLVGDAGSGKSTFIDYLTWRLARAHADGTPAELPPRLRTLLPVRRVAAAIPSDGAAGTADTLWRAFEADCTGRLGQTAAARLLPHLQERVYREGALVLLDGLDEVPESGARRAHLLESVQRFAAALPPGSRVLLSARPYAYADPRWRLTGFAERALARMARR